MTNNSMHDGLHQALARASEPASRDEGGTLIAVALHQGQRKRRQRQAVLGVIGSAACILMVFGMVASTGWLKASDSTIPVASAPSDSPTRAATTPQSSPAPSSLSLETPKNITTSIAPNGYAMCHADAMTLKQQQALGVLYPERFVGVNGKGLTCGEAAAIDRSQDWSTGPQTRVINGFTCTAKRENNGDDVECTRVKDGVAQDFYGMSDRASSRFWQQCQRTPTQPGQAQVYSLMRLGDAAPECATAIGVYDAWKAAGSASGAQGALPADWRCAEATAGPENSVHAWVSCTYLGNDPKAHAQLRIGTQSMVSHPPVSLMGG